MTSSRLPTLLRAMHTAGRRVPHPPLGGAAASGPGGSHTPAPQTTTPHPHPGQPSSSPPTEVIPPTSAQLSTAQPEEIHSLATIPEAAYSPPDPPQRSDGKPWVYPPRIFGRNQKPIKNRPRRTVPVNLPGGYPEPSEYPPTQEYLDTLESADFKPAPPHPLWQFFHVNFAATQPLDGRASTPVEVGAVEAFGSYDAQFVRAWTAAELRYKTFAELHTLWYILLKERNVLYTQREERKRINLQHRGDSHGITSRLSLVRKSMATIKQVLQERRLALQAAVAPHITRVDEDRRPPYPWTDPAKTFEALENTTEFPDVRVPKVLRKLKEKVTGEEYVVGGTGAISQDEVLAASREIGVEQPRERVLRHLHEKYEVAAAENDKGV
ncbi:mitochondrial 39-S ribosomal protein L47 (MRP-L47)-domain-containing protein [Papiliotrema laurentii]|uniref:Large ribosomal subunit protein uL29m n=1 Tax=Papiliotrema laurentii TaxID=5418 RepID=A0AAD9FNX4_PAPLA|nr:mitochondrial 39-S ribosomal protein L47 (MRP-L47)-domain-containing protein [Papiliotrema laurentii]